MTDKRHLVTDAHGRLLNLAPSGEVSQDPTDSRAAGRRRCSSTGVAIAAVLAAGLVLSVLLIVIRDIATTVAGGSVTGLVLRALLTPSDRQQK